MRVADGSGSPFKNINTAFVSFQLLKAFNSFMQVLEFWKLYVHKLSVIGRTIKQIKYLEINDRFMFFKKLTYLHT